MKPLIGDKDMSKKCKHDWLTHETSVRFRTKRNRYVVGVRICSICDKLQAKADKVSGGKWTNK